MVESRQLDFTNVDPRWINTTGIDILYQSLEEFYFRTNDAWHGFGFDLPPVPERNRGYGRVKQRRESFKANFYPHFNHPWPRINFSGWDVELELPGAKEQVDVRLDIEGNLQKLRITRPLEVEPTYRKLDDLVTEARFLDGRLYFFWQEEPNGTFFPDPRGGTDQIWPFWLDVSLVENPKKFRRKINTWNSTKYRISRNRPQLTEKHWQEYLHYVRNGLLVVSGKTLKVVRQTEAQAVRNLEAWRNYIYYKSRQAFEFKLNPGGNPISGVGYVYTNYRDGSLHVSKNPVHYHPLGNFETAERFSSWELPF